MKIPLSSRSPFIVAKAPLTQPGKSADDTAGRSAWLTASEAAEYLKVRTRSLLLWVRQGKIKAYALSGTKRRVWRLRREDIDAALLAHPVLMSETPTVLSKQERRIA
jgi:excisionase family DNA binding protein